MVEDPCQDDPSSESRESKPVPVTSSLRTTIKHLRTSAGPFFWMRGLFYFLFYKMVFNGNAFSYLPNLDDSWIMKMLAGLILGWLVTNWQVTWVHAIISQPSTKSPLERFLRLRTSATIFSALTMQITLHSGSFKWSTTLEGDLMDYLGIRFDPNNSYQVLAAGLLPNLVQTMVITAVRVVFVRIAASRLPEDEPPIVRLDPSLHNEEQGLGITDIWSTLNSPAPRRALKILVRQYGISLAITLLGEMVQPDFFRHINFPVIWFL